MNRLLWFYKVFRAKLISKVETKIFFKRNNTKVWLLLVYIIWWLRHSSKLNFISQKLFRMLWWSDFILMISLKFFAGICNPLPNLNFFRVKFFVMNSASGADDEATTTVRSKQTNFPQIFESKLKMNLLFPAKSLKKMKEIICNHHKIWNNFCEMKINSEECPCHHTL